MNVDIATPEQTQELSRFFKKFETNGPVDIRVDRRGDFFAPYRIQGDDFRTYVLNDETGIHGVVTFVVQEVWLQGQPTRVAFARDLRISSNRRAVMGWTKHFLPVLEELRQDLGVHSVFSSISMYDQAAMNAFTRPRTVKRPFPRYYLFRRFNLVSLHGRFPWAPKPLPSLRIRHANKHFEDALVNYVTRKSRERELGRIWSGDVFYRQLARWPGLNLEDFLIATDHADNIVGCTASWSAGGLEDYIPMNYGIGGHNFRQFLKFGHLFGWTRNITKPVHRLGLEGPLDFRYLNFLFADHEDVFESLAYTAFEEARPTEFLVYLQMRSDLHLRRPRTWVSAKIPSSLYCLVPPTQEQPEFLHPRNDRPVDLGPFFV